RGGPGLFQPPDAPAEPRPRVSPDATMISDPTMIPDPTTIPDADLYEELGLEPGADEADVRRAFRRRAFDLHPDRHPDPDAARAAYAALVSPAHREAVRAAADAARVVHEVLRTALSAPPRVRPWRGPGPLRFTLEGGPHGLAPETAA